MNSFKFNKLHFILRSRRSIAKCAQFSSSTNDNEKKPLQSYMGSKKKLSEAEKQMLLLTKVYKKREDIPDYVDSTHEYRKGRDRLNIIVTLFIMAMIPFLVLYARNVGLSESYVIDEKPRKRRDD